MPKPDKEVPGKRYSMEEGCYRLHRIAVASLRMPSQSISMPALRHWKRGLNPVAYLGPAAWGAILGVLL